MSVARLSAAEKRVHTLLGWVGELERKDTPDLMLYRIATRALREATQELRDAAYEAVATAKRPQTIRRAKWEVSADAVA